MYPGCTRNAYHLFMMRYDASRFAGLPRGRFLETMRAVYTEKEIARWRERNHCPANDRLCAEGLWLGQPVLMGAGADMEDIVLAMKKVEWSAAAIKGTA